jgi:hypothetical protein
MCAPEKRAGVMRERERTLEERQLHAVDGDLTRRVACAAV